MEDVLTTKELEMLRNHIEVVHGTESCFLLDARKLLAALDEANKEIAKLRRQIAYNKGSHF